MEQTKAGSLKSYFEHIHDDTIKLSWIFNEIEGTELTDTNIVGHSKAEENFYSRYIIAIVKDCTTDIDCDVLLALYGFMDGYAELNISDRRSMYCQNVGIYSQKDRKNLPLIEHWGNIKSNMTNRENKATKHLLKELNQKISKGSKPTPYVKNAYELTKKPYPIPNYLSGKGYQKYEIDGKVFYVPLTPEERRLQASKTIAKSTFSSEGLVPNNNSVKDEETFQKTQTDSVKEFGEGNTYVKNYSEGKKKLWKAKIKDLGCFVEKHYKIIWTIPFCILSFASIAIVILELYDKPSLQQGTKLTQYTPSDEEEIIKIEGIYILNNKPIVLTPDDHPQEKLEVEPYPREVYKDELNYTSGNNHLVTVSRKTEIVKLGSNWQEETERNTEITIQSGEVEAKVEVRVQDNVIDSFESELEHDNITDEVNISE